MESANSVEVGGVSNPKQPPSRGIPSKESLWLPKHYGAEIKRKGGLEKTVIWGVEDVLDFVFPKRYQLRCFEVACCLLNLLLERKELSSKELTRFLGERGFSKSTVENVVIPKLVKFGLVKRERVPGRRRMLLTLSLTFASYLEKIAFAWRCLVETARKKLEGEGI